MASTKGNAAIWTATTLTAGSGPTTSSAVDFIDGYGGTVNIKITNGATGPTTPAKVAFQTSPDNSTWFTKWEVIAGAGNSQVSEWGDIDIHQSTKYWRLSATHPTGQNVTIDAQYTETSALS